MFFCGIGHDVMCFEGVPGVEYSGGPVVDFALSGKSGSLIAAHFDGLVIGCAI